MKNLSLYVFIFCLVSVQAQFGIEWHQTHGGSSMDRLKNLSQTSDGGYIMIGESNSTDGDVSNNYGVSDVWIVKTDSTGNLQWEKNYGGSNMDIGNSIIQTLDGGYIFTGRTNSNDIDISSNIGNYDVWVVKIDTTGNIEWEKTYGTTYTDAGDEIFEESNGYVIIGTARINIAMNIQELYYLKIDYNGDIITEIIQQIPQHTIRNINHVKKTSDNGYLVVGNSFLVLGSDYKELVCKLDSTGNITWFHTHGLGERTVEDFIQINDSSLITVGHRFQFTGTPSKLVLRKFSINGDLIWEKLYGGMGNESSISIFDIGDGAIVFGNSTSDDGDLFNALGQGTGWVFKIDYDGNIIYNFKTNYGANLTKGIFNNDNDFIFGGILNPITTTKYHILKFNNDLEQVFGRVIIDNNNNCNIDLNDFGTENIIIEIKNLVNNGVFYSSTDSQGNFNIYIDSSPHTFRVSNMSELYTSSNCSSDTIQITTSNHNLSDTLYFYKHPEISCPSLVVDIASPFLRRCLNSNYHVSYINNGTQLAENVKIVVDFDENITINSATIPWSSSINNVYTFQIGNLNIFESGDFSINVTVDCDSTFIGQVLCAEARIYPDTFCISNPSWNGAELQAKVNCLGSDTVEYSIKNIGTGNMTDPAPAIVIEDVILRLDTAVQLNVNEVISWRLPNLGISQRIVASQPAEHPYRTFTTAAVNLCNNQGIVFPGPVLNNHFNAFPNDDEASFVAIDCQPVIGSYDPNDKLVQPTGSPTENYISDSTDLEYKIRFQNTGNDTAFLVYIVDHISPKLDMNSIIPGSSSHDYSFEAYGQNIIKFTFNNIMLPDSSTDFEGSQGFVKFKIKQKSNNMFDDVIDNSANIFFDFNPPILTNTVFNTIGNMILDTIIYKFNEELLNINGILDNSFKVYPNPASNYMVFEFDEIQELITINLVTIDGKLANQYTSLNQRIIKIYRGDLATGMYFFNIKTSKGEVATGKIIFN